MPEREFWEKVFMQLLSDWDWETDIHRPADLICLALMADEAARLWKARFSEEAPFE